MLDCIPVDIIFILVDPIIFFSINPYGYLRVIK